MMNPFARLSVSLAALAVVGALVSAQPSLPSPQTSALINRELDQRIKLNFNNVPLPQVFASIEQQTGVPLRTRPEVYDLLPYGTQTPITASLELPLRDALQAICGKLGLQANLREESVEVAPEAALRRVGRRATVQELRTLDLLAARRLEGAAEYPDLLTLTQSIDRSLAALEAERKQQGEPAGPIVLELRSTEGVDVETVKVRLHRGTTLRDALDAIADQTRLTWYPWGDSVVVVPKRTVIRNQLDRVVSLRYDGIDITQVFADLAAQTGVDFMIEPGAIQRVPPEFRIIKLSADAPIRQSLESLQGYTGLGYAINDEGVYIWNQNSTPAAGRPRVIATVEIAPGTSILIHEDQLSPAARDAIARERQKAAERVEASLTGKTPTTQPEHFN